MYTCYKDVVMFMKKCLCCIFLLTILSLILSPFRVDAIHVTSKANNGYDGNCKDFLGINIEADPYKRHSGWSNDDSYWNNIEGRGVTISANEGTGEYKVFIYTADYGELNELTEEYEEGEDIDDVCSKSKTCASSTAIFNTKYPMTVPANKESLIIVISAKKKLYTHSGYPCAEYDKENPTVCKRWTDIYCSKGKFIKTSNDVSDVEISGNAASLFVQNPQKVNFVGNVQKGDIACNNARNGIYSGENPKYVVKNEDKAEWENYYKKILSFCDEDFVPFNLKDKHIRQLTDDLLDIFMQQNNLKEKIKLRQISSLNDIQNDINSFTNAERKQKNELSNINLSCDYSPTSTNSKEYLYVSDIKEISATLSNDDNINICKSQCYEHLTVKYSPPQVVKAGLCFNYKVTVKSETKCGIWYNEDFWSELNEKEMCSPTPICEAQDSHTQAGPSEDFDNCVKSCDNGAYSQKCINKCYKEVYSNSKKNTKKIDSSNKNSNAKLSLDSNIKSSLKNMKNSSTSEYNEYGNTCKEEKKETAKSCLNLEDDGACCFKYYYLPKFTATDCKTEKIKKYVENKNNVKLKQCAKYYFEAKSVRPRMSYTCNGSGMCTSTYSPDVTTDDSKPGPTSNIEMSIARASTFYIRDVDTTMELLKFLVKREGKEDRRYVIDENGFKRQVAIEGKYSCTNKCKYQGCTNENALTSLDYYEGLNNDLNLIADKLTECGKITTACDGSTNETHQTDYTINVTTNKQDNSSSTETKTGTTEFNKTYPISSNGDEDMFISDTDDDESTGITGYCYDKLVLNPHYQTTITFPGSWINLKAGEVFYTEQDININRVKKYYYCTPYNSTDINVPWWEQVVYKKSESLPVDFNPTMNITADLGQSPNDTGTGEQKGFGEYNWHINFSCFYAQKDNPSNIPPTPPVCENSLCKEFECYDAEGNVSTCPEKEQPTKLNYDIRVVALDNLFPNNRLRGFNWGRAAKLQSKDTSVQTLLSVGGYDIDPVEYSTKVMEKGESKTYIDSERDFHVILDAEDINLLKSENLEYGGKYSNKEIIPGLRYYMMDSTFKSTYGINTNWQLGINNK